METEQERAPPPDREACTLLVEPAVRCFQAEVAAQERNATRRNLVLTAILASIGFGAFRIGWLQEQALSIEPVQLLWLLRTLLLLSLALFARALFVLLSVPAQRSRKSGADGMPRLPQDVLNARAYAGYELAWKAVFDANYEMYLVLKPANRADGKRIDRAQQVLVVALLLLVLAYFGYNLAVRWI